MGRAAGVGELSGDEEALAGYATALADAVEAAIPAWVGRSARGVLSEQGIEVDAALAARLDEAAARARDDGAPRIRRLLATDIDEQLGNPLAVLRDLVRYPTAVLAAAGARPVPRDDFDTRAFPDDAYGLTPASFADVDPHLAEPGLLWGAAKAHVHLIRRRQEGKR